MRLAVLSSTRGTNLIAMVHAIQEKRLNASIEIVISNKKEALILSRAQSFGLSTAFVDANGLTREVFDNQVNELLEKHAIDLIVLVGYMRILSGNFVNKWKNKIINIHPSLLPHFSGKMDLAVHEAVLAAGVSESGCTVHYVTEELDAGPIILQKRCAVYADDTPLSLKERVQALEGEALVEALHRLTKQDLSLE